MNVLLVGAGLMGANHARTLNALPEVKKIFAVDPSEDALKRLGEKNFEKVSCFGSLDAVLKEEEFKAAVVAAPTQQHYEITRRLLGESASVLVEKPLADSVGKAERLVEEAREKKLVLAVGHIERFNPAVQSLKHHISWIGGLVHASAHRFGVPTPRELGHSFMDQAVHDIDVISFLSGEYPQTVAAVERCFLDKKSFDSCAAIFEFPSFTATVEANRVTPIKTRELILTGLKGSARLDYITQDLTITKAEHDTTKYSSFDEIVLRVGRGTEVKPYFVKDEPLKLELQNFLHCVRSGEKPAADGEAAVRAIAAVEAAIKSVKTGAKEKIAI